MPGLHRVEDLLGGPTAAHAAAARSIDVVYTWVNDADPG